VDQPLVVGPSSVATGSGAGGLGPDVTPDGDGEKDTYKTGLWTDINGNNLTTISGMNGTHILGNDTYRTHGSADSIIYKNNSTLIEGNDTYCAWGSLDSTVKGNNSTKINGDDHYSLDGTAYSEIKDNNHTEIYGDDYYKAAQSFSNVWGNEFSYSTNKLEATVTHSEIDAVHLEACGLHIEFNAIKADGEILSKDGAGIKILSFG
jgi:hypothetical protein